MKARILSALIGFGIAAMIFCGGNRPELIQPTRVEAQATTTKADLISNYRANATAFVNWKNTNISLRAQYDALAYTWADGDFTGSNAGITASQFTTAVTNLSNLVTAFNNGSTIASGYPTTIYRISQ